MRVCDDAITVEGTGAKREVMMGVISREVEEGESEYNDDDRRLLFSLE